MNSAQATRFRIWATNTLREFIVKGFVLDDERLKLNKRFGTDYFDELLERIRKIRASERRFYLKITDIYEQCSVRGNSDRAQKNEARRQQGARPSEYFRVLRASSNAAGGEGSRLLATGVGFPECC